MRIIFSPFNGLKADLRNNYPRLLLAAVLLFILSWLIILPVKGVEKILAACFNQDNEPTTIEALSQELPCPAEPTLTNHPYSTNNVLASLTDDQSNFTKTDTNTNQASQTEDNNLVTVQSSALFSQDSPITSLSQDPRSGLISYTVQNNDTISSIATFFGISAETILWANNLKATSLIRPGDELTILPVNGVLHRVKNNETIESIAKTYKAEVDDIIAYNALPADGRIQISQKLIIPDGQMPTPVAPAPKSAPKANYAGPGTGKSRTFPYGQCTWYVAQKRYVPWSGNAKDWLANARAYGFQTGSAPQVGAVISLSGGNWLSRRYGHVAYVESINGGWITFSEMNHLGWGIKSVRTIKITDPSIRGYIY